MPPKTISDSGLGVLPPFPLKRAHGKPNNALGGPIRVFPAFRAVGVDARARNIIRSPDRAINPYRLANPVRIPRELRIAE